jgi:NAD(P)H-hydrate epimerase
MLPYEAACLAVYLHGLAGDAAAAEKGKYSMMAGDIVNSIEKVITGR